MVSRGSGFFKKSIHKSSKNDLEITDNGLDQLWKQDLARVKFPLPDINSPVHDDMSMVFHPTGGLALSVDQNFLSVGLGSGSPGLLSPPRTPPAPAFNQHLSFEVLTSHSNPGYSSLPSGSWMGTTTSQGLLQPSSSELALAGNLHDGTAIVFDHTYSIPAAASVDGWVYSTPTPYSSPAAAAPAPAWAPPMAPALPVSPTLAFAKALRQFRCDMLDTKWSQRTDQSKVCQSSFKQRKDLIRHKRTVHATGDDPYYRCACATEGVRKDNYLRHVRDCSREPRYSYYLCKCQNHCEDKKEHMDHVTHCQFGFGRHGRPSAM